jgi:hypothetical protein
MSSAGFTVTPDHDVVSISGPTDGGTPITRRYRLGGTGQQAYLDFHAAVARDFGLVAPSNRRPAARPPHGLPYRVLLTENLAPGILYGYGDPAVIRIDDGASPGWYLLATSNDAPEAFPILHSPDLVRWEPRGFVFPRGRTPAWAATGEGASDYWAAEMHRIGGRFVVVFTARALDGTLAIGTATAAHPEGPFAAAAAPLLAGGVIDSHLLSTSDGRLLLYWKEDSNALWPGRLAELLAARPALAEPLFAGETAAVRTARFIGAAQAWIAARPPMEQFALHQPLIEIVVERFAAVRARLRTLATQEPALAAEADAILEAMRTRIFAQPLCPETLALTGTPQVVLENDLDWEGHLVEGVWVSEQQGRFYAFYAANDFATDAYGIGVGIGDTPLGPFRKAAAPLLASCANWSGPGHPSVAPGPDGEPLLFLHAYVPGTAGYKAFRALLAMPLRFEPDRVVVGDAGRGPPPRA